MLLLLLQQQLITQHSTQLDLFSLSLASTACEYWYRKNTT